MRRIVAPPSSAIVVAMLVLAACGSAGETAATPSSATSGAADPTLAQTASPEPGASGQGVPSGWERTEIEEEGFAIALPRGWEVADLSSGDIEDMLEILGDDPQFQAFADQLPTLMASGIALFAVSIDAGTLDTGFATNLNVFVQDDVTTSLDLYAAANVSFIESTFAVDVEQESLALAAGDASRVEYEPTVDQVGTYHVTQYIILGDGSALIATFSRAIGDDFEALEADFLDIMETLAFLP